MTRFLDASRALYDDLHRALGKDTVLLFHIGDFYEAFWDDADRLAEACSLIRTTRHLRGGRAPMTGVMCGEKNALLAHARRAGLRVAVIEPDDEVAP